MSIKKVVFVAYGTVGDVFPMLSVALNLKRIVEILWDYTNGRFQGTELATAFPNAASHIEIVFLTHKCIAEDLSLRTGIPLLHKNSRARRKIPLRQCVWLYLRCTANPPLREGLTSSFSKEEETGLVEICGDADLIVFNFFSVICWHIASLRQIKRIIISPCLIPSKAPEGFWATFKRNYSDDYKALVKLRKKRRFSAGSSSRMSLKSEFLRQGLKMLLSSGPRACFEGECVQRSLFLRKLIAYCKRWLSNIYGSSCSIDDFRYWMWRLCLDDHGHFRKHYLKLPEDIFTNFSSSKDAMKCDSSEPYASLTPTPIVYLLSPYLLWRRERLPYDSFTTFVGGSTPIWKDVSYLKLKTPSKRIFWKYKGPNTSLLRHRENLKICFHRSCRATQKTVLFNESEIKPPSEAISKELLLRKEPETFALDALKHLIIEAPTLSTKLLFRKATSAFPYIAAGYEEPILERILSCDLRALSDEEIFKNLKNFLYCESGYIYVSFGSMHAEEVHLVPSKLSLVAIMERVAEALDCNVLIHLPVKSFEKTIGEPKVSTGSPEKPSVHHENPSRKEGNSILVIEGTFDTGELLELTQCKAALTHGGAGSAVAISKARLPHVIVPRMFDQITWGRRLSSRGLAVNSIETVGIFDQIIEIEKETTFRIESCTSSKVGDDEFQKRYNRSLESSVMKTELARAAASISRDISRAIRLYSSNHRKTMKISHALRAENGSGVAALIAAACFL